jgi:hypothetical protein
MISSKTGFNTNNTTLPSSPDDGEGCKGPFKIRSFKLSTLKHWMHHEVMHPGRRKM